MKTDKNIVAKNKKRKADSKKVFFKFLIIETYVYLIFMFICNHM